MAIKKSVLIHRILLVGSALAVVLATVLISMRLLEPAVAPVLPPPKKKIAFDPKADIRTNGLFNELQIFFSGQLQVGALGNPFPFGKSEAGTGAVAPGSSRLSVMEEISLLGAVAKDVARSADGRVMVLLFGLVDDETVVYEVRAFQSDGKATTLASWKAKPSVVERVTAIAQDRTNRIWIGDMSGRIGMIATSTQTEPTWYDGAKTGLSMPVTSIAVDGIDQIWATDGSALTVGGDQSFTPIDLVQKISQTDQTAFQEALHALPNKSDEDPAALMRLALAPQKISSLRDGRVSVNTGFGMFLFPLSLSQSPEWRMMLASSTFPLAVSPSGGIWGSHYSDGTMNYSWATGTKTFPSKDAVPKQALLNMQLFASNDSSLYTVDYSPTSTSFFWSSSGEDWQAGVVVASGTAPLDIPVKTAVDNKGDVWLLMKQGGLVRVTRKQGMNE